MPYIIRRTYIAVGNAELTPRLPESDHQGSGDATLVFYRAASEGLRHPGDVVSLLQDEGIKAGTLRARNPITHDQWWIPVTALAASGAPYAKALASVVRAWLKERKGRRVELKYGRSKITGTPADTERLFRAIAKHEKELGRLHVTGSKAAVKKTAARNNTVKKKATGK
jgi:hypothetical protein